jgi:uncharacterized protein with GYD domain
VFVNMLQSPLLSISVAGPLGSQSEMGRQELVGRQRDRKHIGQESNMTIYISQGRYTAAAIRAMTARPEDRSQAIAEMLAAAGGHLIGWYLTLGRYDWLIVAEAPDERTLVSAVLAAAAGGSLSDITTTVALSAEDTVKAFGQAGELAKKFRSAGADYYGVPVESVREIATGPK